MWRTINKVLNKDMQSTVLSNINEGGKVLTEDSDMLEALNRHFVSVGTNLAKKIISKPDDDCLKYVVSVNNKMTLNTINTKYVLDAIGRLKNGKASGPDKITIKLAKDAAKFIAYPIMCIFNSSITNGIFPDVWKTANVTPIHKSGSKSDLNNYRPISVISVFARMLERLVHDQLSEFLTFSNILTSSQAAFRKLNSTTTSLISSTDHWHENMDNNKMNLAIFLDLRKAFDTVDHSILIKKLNSYGIVDRTGDWFESYLTNRTQFCTLNGNKSKQRKVTCGIPQGSCLGPLLFIIYLNDFENSLQYSRASIYADDTNVTIASDDIQRMIDNASQEMLNLSEWMRINKLSPNPQKTEFMIIGHPLKAKHPSLPESLVLNDHNIKRVTQTKSLGLIVDENLSWEAQFNRTMDKINSGIWALKRLKNILPQSQLSIVYYALVESQLRYGDVVWGNLSRTKLAALQRLQTRALKIIRNAKIKDTWSCPGMNVENIICFDRNVMAYKIIHKLYPNSFLEKYKPRSSFSSYNTRNSQNLQIPKHRTERYKKSFHYSALKEWNNTPRDIRELPTINTFKRQLKVYMKSKT